MATVASAAAPLVAAEPVVQPVAQPVVVPATAGPDWKLALIRLVEAFAWPAAFVLVALIFRVPLAAFITALARSVGH